MGCDTAGSSPVRLGAQWHGAVMSALRASALSAAFNKGRCGGLWLVGSVEQWQGQFWHVAARADDLSAEPHGALRWVLWNPDVARLVWVGHGSAGSGLAL